MVNHGTRPAIVWAGVACGLMDLAAAYFVLWHPRGTPAIRGLQGIASGLLGRSAMNGGMAAAALGAAIHFSIAFVAASIYVVAARLLPILRAQTLLAGLLYGVAVYLVMYGAVLPMSAIGRVPLNATGVLIHMFCVGLPIALAARFAM